jgi:taurine dioxygenase
MNIRTLSQYIGSEIDGIDVTSMDDALLDRAKKMLADRGVLFFKDQDLTPRSQLEFAERWGQINVNRFFTPVEEEPQVAMVLKEPQHLGNIGGQWHTDHSYDEIPAMASMLYARELPSRGGDTLFASMYGAYETLSPGMKKMLIGLRAVHSSRHVFGDENKLGDRFQNADQAVQDAIHPAVISHPESARSALYVNPNFTLRFDGWTQDESTPILNYLYQIAIRPENTIRYPWSVNTLAIWDNRCTWHYAMNDYHGEKRLMHRITLEGTRLASAER